MRIAIVLYDGFDELDAIAPFEVFENAADEGADLTVTLCSFDGTDTVTASHGLRVGVETQLHDTSPDVVLVPGGGWNDRQEPGAWAEAERGDLPSVLSRLYNDGVTVAAVCTGGMLLVHAGLLDDRPATTHSAALAELRESAARAVEARVVDDGDLLTAGGVTSGLDLAFHLVEREFGPELADAVRRRMEYESRGTVRRTS